MPIIFWLSSPKRRSTAITPISLSLTEKYRKGTKMGKFYFFFTSCFNHVNVCTRVSLNGAPDNETLPAWFVNRPKPPYNEYAVVHVIRRTSKQDPRAELSNHIANSHMGRQAQLLKLHVLSSFFKDFEQYVHNKICNCNFLVSSYWLKLSYSVGRVKSEFKECTVNTCQNTTWTTVATKELLSPHLWRIFLFSWTTLPSCIDLLLH